MKIKTDYLIVGASVAGISAATAIREREPGAKIVILSKEPVAFYSRVLLADYINGKMAKEKLMLRDKDWFAEKKIDLYLDEAAKALDSKNHIVKTSRANEFFYKKLLIATGVHPARLPVLGSEIEGVFYLWDLADAKKIKKKMAETGGGKIAVIGGGFICQAFVKIFSHKGFEVNLLMRGKYYWSRFVDEYTGELLNKEFEDEGVFLHKEERVKEIIKKDQGLIVRTEKGIEIEADLVLVGVGMIPNVSWLENSGIELDDGVRVNEFLKTNLDDVYAAGDVVNFYDVLLEDFHRQGNWVNADRQGRIAGINMTGGEEAYREVTAFTLAIGKINFIFMGEYNRNRADNIVVRRDVDRQQVREYLFKNNRLIGAILANCPQDRPLIEKAIKAKIELTKNEKLSLGQAEIPLDKTKIYGFNRKNN